MDLPHIDEQALAIALMAFLLCLCHHIPIHLFHQCSQQPWVDCIRHLKFRNDSHVSYLTMYITTIM